MLSSLTLVLQRFSSQAHPSTSTVSQVQQSRGALLQISVTTLATMLSLPTKTRQPPTLGKRSRTQLDPRRDQGASSWLPPLRRVWRRAAGSADAPAEL